MTISVTFDFPHDSVDLYYQVFEKGGAAIVEQPARLHHQCFQNGDGWTVIDVWESEESFAAFGGILGPTLQALGLSTVPVVHRTYRTMTQSGEVRDY